MTDPSYSLGRPERRGAVFGWRPGQALAVACGAIALVAGVGTDRVAGTVLGAFGAVAGCAIATVPLRGRGLDEWLPVFAGFLTRARRGLLCHGAAVQPAGHDPAHLQWPDGRATVVVAIRHRGLRALCAEPAAFSESVATWLRGLGSAPASSWVVTLLCETSAAPAARTSPWSDPGCRVAEFVAITADEPVDAATVLGEGGVRGVVQLGAGALGELMARRVAPAPGSLLDGALTSRWHFLEGPSTLHASFVVDEWPSGLVDEQALAPLCISRDRRTVALSIRIEELHRARARTERLRTSTTADRMLAQRGGFLTSAEASREEARDEERAAELAAGHGSVRVVGTVGLDARDELELEAAAARLLADATSSGIRLRRCDGDHRRGVLATVPGWCVP